MFRAVDMPKIPPPRVMPLADWKPEPGDMPMMIEGQAEGADVIPNGSAIVKVWSEPGDANPVGTKGKVLASARAGDSLGYFVEWETYPGVPVFLHPKKIGRA